MRFDTGKMRFDLLPPEALVELARIYTMGAIKYDDNNWRKGMDWSKCIGSLERHLNKWKAGQSLDKDTGCHHLAQVAWNALTLMIYEMHGSGNDDRVAMLSIDDNFKWQNTNVSPGLSPEKMQEFVRKYGKQRD